METVICKDTKEICYPFAPEIWVCPECANEQNSNFEWCGKNLKCQRCGTYSYYNEWVVEG